MVPANNPTYTNLVATTLALAVAWLPLFFLLTTYQLTTNLEIQSRNKMLAWHSRPCLYWIDCGFW